MLQLTFNPGLMFISFRTTRPSTLTDTDFFRFNTLKRTAKAPAVASLRMNTLRGYDE